MGASPAPESLLERTSDLERIEALLTQAMGGAGSVLLVQGPAGIGKTSLLASIRDLACAREVDVLTARGGELEAELPFAVVQELLAKRVSGAPAGERRHLLAGAAALAAPVIGVHGDAPDESRATQAARLHGLFWLCSNLADRGTLLLIVDDVHWADSSSLRFLAHLAGRITELPILLALGRRTGEARTHEAQLDAIRAQGCCSVLEPTPLSVSAVASILADTYAEAVDDEFAQACHTATGGNPFYIGELALTLRREQVPPSTAHAQEVPAVAPDRIAAALRGRLARLSPAAVGLARAVSVLGTEVPLRHAARLARIDDDVASQAADHLAAADLVEPRRPLAFRHPIIRSVVYGDLSAGERAADHARAARQLADEGAPVEEVARHLVLAEGRVDPWAVDALRDAGRTALDRGAPGVARTYLRRALAESPQAATRGAVLADLGTAELAVGDPVAIETLTEALTLTSPGRRAEIASFLAVAFDASARHDDAVAMLRKEIPAVARLNPDAALQLEAAMLSSASLSSGTFAPADDVIARLDGLRGETPGERLLLANGAWYTALVDGRADRTVEVAERALVDGHLLTEQRVDAPPFWLAIAMLMYAERFEQHLAQVEAAQIAAARSGSEIGGALVLCHRAFNAYLRGAIADAVDEASESVRVATDASWSGGLPLVVGGLVLALVEAARFDEAEGVLSQYEMTGELPSTQLCETVLVGRAALSLARGRAENALRDLRTVEEQQRRRGTDTAWPIWAWRPLAVRALASTGQREQTRSVAEEAFRVASRWGTPGAVAAALRARAVAEEGEASIQLLAQAVAGVDGSGAGLERMHALLDLGSALRRTRPSEAREPLTSALDQAERSGAELVAGRARDELAATGVKRRKRTYLSGVDALTPSEGRVAAMAAEGMTNPQIAQTLFVTRKTVEKHLANAYSKLEIRSREELPQALG